MMEPESDCRLLSFVDGLSIDVDASSQRRAVIVIRQKGEPVVLFSFLFPESAPITSTCVERASHILSSFGETSTEGSINLALHY